MVPNGPEEFEPKPPKAGVAAEGAPNPGFTAGILLTGAPKAGAAVDGAPKIGLLLDEGAPKTGVEVVGTPKAGATEDGAPKVGVFAGAPKVGALEELPNPVTLVEGATKVEGVVVEEPKDPRGAVVLEELNPGVELKETFEEPKALGAVGCEDVCGRVEELNGFVGAVVELAVNGLVVVGVELETNEVAGGITGWVVEPKVKPVGAGVV